MLWTDSISVLKYIKNKTQRFRTFAANRVSATREASYETQRYINTKLKQADHASCGLKADAFLKCSSSVLEWPKLPELDLHSSNEPEIKKKKKKKKKALPLSIGQIMEPTSLQQKTMKGCHNGMEHQQNRKKVQQKGKNMLASSSI